MAVNKVIYGGKTLLDLTDSNVTPETLTEGIIAYNAKGERIIGTLLPGEPSSDKNAVGTATVIDETVGDILIGAPVDTTASDSGEGDITLSVVSTKAASDDGNGNITMK